jgi:Xaa-Pro aminopeptidase
MRNDLSVPGVLKELQKRIPPGGAFVLTSSSDIRYVSRFYVQGEILVVPKKGRPVCFVDAMNGPLAEKRLMSGGIRVVPGKDRLADHVAESLNSKDIEALFVDTGNIPAGEYLRVTRKINRGKVNPGPGTNYVRIVLDGMRAVKGPDEISLLRFAARETIKIWKKASRRIRPGMTEIEIARMVDVLILEAGYENSFPTIAAAGGNSAYPHAIPTNKRLGKREHVVVDFGIRHKLYCSDLTRIWGECRINGQIRSFLKKVREVQKEAINCVGPGVSIRGTAEKMNGLLAASGFGKFIMHGMGHGIGLDVHERPHFGISSGGKFEKGMVITVEPGLYDVGKGGVRVEDMVLVTREGSEVLTI